MAYIGQICIIISISFIGEVLYAVLPLPVPASIYGLLLMLGGLCMGIIKLPQVEKVGTMLVDMLPLFLVPATVGIITMTETLKQIFMPFLILTTLGTAIVMGVSALVTQSLMKGEK